MSTPSDEQLKQITQTVVGLQSDLKEMNDAIDDLKKGQQSIIDILEEIEKHDKKYA